MRSILTYLGSTNESEAVQNHLDVFHFSKFRVFENSNSQHKLTLFCVHTYFIYYIIY